MNEEAMRKAFEDWAASEARSLSLAVGGHSFAYAAGSTALCWAAWQAATRAAVPSWQPIETAPKSEADSFMVLRDGVAIQVSWFEGRLYPDALGYLVDWHDGITDATHWAPRLSVFGVKQ